MSGKTKPRLSAAIREGCKIAPQQCTRAYIERESGGILRTCAIGAALVSQLGVGTVLNYDGDMRKYVEKTFHGVSFALGKSSQRAEEVVLHPVRKTSRPVLSVVMDLNDVCGWTREQIADWLEGIGL